MPMYLNNVDAFGALVTINAPAYRNSADGDAQNSFLPKLHERTQIITDRMLPRHALRPPLANGSTRVPTLRTN